MKFHRACVVCGDIGGPEVYLYRGDVCGLGSVGFSLRCCETCGMVQQDPAVPPETIAQQYRLFSNYLSFIEGDPGLPLSTVRMLKLLDDNSVAPGRIFDIGASSGDALWHFRRLGWTVFGCEPSPNAVAQARQRGIDVDLGLEEDTLSGHRDLDLVTSSHVFEHLYDPAATLRRVHEALGPQGLLLIEVPCLTEPEATPPGLFTIEHVNYFEEVSLVNLFEANGFTPVEVLVTLDAKPRYTYPVMTVLARKTTARTPIRSSFARNRDYLARYTAHEIRKWQEVDDRMESHLQPGEPVCIWGAGMHTSNLLRRTRLAHNHPIVAITDRDTQKHGYTLGAHKIVPPDAVLAGREPIVVSSYDSEVYIAADLRKRGVEPGRIVCPHDRKAEAHWWRPSGKPFW